MSRHCLRSTLVGSLLAALPALGAAQRVVPVELTGSPASASFRFEPTRVEASPGDVLEFRVRNGGPYLIAFSGDSLEPSARMLLDQAMPDRSGPLRSSLLRRPGATYRIVLPPLPPGTYRFFAPTHLSYRMTGRLWIRRGNAP